MPITSNAQLPEVFNWTRQSEYAATDHPEKLWSYPGTGLSCFCSPVINAAGEIFILAEGDLYAIDPHGKLKWKYAAGRATGSPAIGSDGTIYINNSIETDFDFISDDEDVDPEDDFIQNETPGCGVLEAIDPQGELIWSREYECNEFIGNPTLAKGEDVIYIASIDGEVHAINSRTGKLIWSVPLSVEITNSLAVGSDGTIYAGLAWTNRAPNGKLFAIRPNGTVKWVYQSDLFASNSAPTVGNNGVVYVAGTTSVPTFTGSYLQGNLLAIDQDGALIWTFKADGDLRSSPAVSSDGKILIGSSLGNGGEGLYALNAQGKVEWTFPAPHGMDSSSPVISADGTVLIGALDGHLYAVNPNGQEKWRFQTGSYVNSNAAIGSNGSVYFTSDDRNLYVLR